MSSLLRLAAVLLVATGMLAGTVESALAADAYRIRVELVDVGAYPDVRLVVSVVDAAGRPVKGLNAADLVVTEDGAAVRPQVNVASVSAPVALAFVVDASGSMAGAPLQEA